MSVVGGIDIHRSQLTFDYVDLDSGEVFRGRIAPAMKKPTSRPAWTVWRSPWRAAQVGVMLLRSSGARASSPMSPSRPRQRRDEARSAGPRPTAPTLNCCGICCWKVGFRSRGFHQNRCWRLGHWSGSTRTCSMSAPAGCSGCRPVSITWAPWISTSRRCRRLAGNALLRRRCPQRLAPRWTPACDRSID